MKKVLSLLKAYIRRPRFAGELVLGLALALLGLWLNEKNGGERTWIDSSPSLTVRLLKYLALYLSAFGGGYLLQILLYPKDKNLRLPGLWLGIFVAALLFALRAWIQPEGLMGNWVPASYYTFAWKCFYNGAGLVLLALPVLLFWHLSGDYRRMPAYGLSAKEANLKPYFGLLALMLIPLLWAAMQPDFQAYYPRGAWLNLPPDGANNGLLTVFYELIYSLDFVVTEFFFRGFLILHFARFAGEKAIMPMALFYLIIHFDKPIAEAVSSFFGGMILGVLALQSRSVFGGIIVHLGIALLMELLGWWRMMG